MPKIEEDLQTWSSRFESLGISKQLLTDALSLKPEETTLDALFTICEKIHAQFPNYKFLTSWELVMLSCDLRWVQRQIELIPENVVTGEVALTPAHFAAESGNTDCLFAVLDKYPRLETAETTNGWTIAVNAVLFSGADHLNKILNRVPKLLNDKRELLSTALFYENLECTLVLADKFDEFPDDLINRIWMQLISTLIKENEPSRVISIYKKMSSWRNISGCSVTHLLAIQGAHRHLLALLEDSPTLLQTNNGASLLHYAAFGGNRETVRAILRKYPNLRYAVDADGKSFAHYGAWHASSVMADEIIALAPELIDQGDHFGFTVLHQVAYHGIAASLEALGEHLNLVGSPALYEKLDHFGNSVATYANMATLCAQLYVATEKLSTLQDNSLDEDLQLLEKAVDMLESWQTDDLIHELYSVQLGRSFRLYDQVAKYLINLFKNHHIMVDAKIVRLLPNIELYGLYFSGTLIDTIDYLKQCSADKKMSPRIIRKSFLSAMVFCQNLKGQIIHLHENHQKLFDTYLQSATVGYHSDSISERLSIEARLQLLHRLILNELNDLQQTFNDEGLVDIIASLNAATPSSFAQAQHQLLNLSCSDDEFSDLINALQYTEKLAQKVHADQQLLIYSKNCLADDLNMRTTKFVTACAAYQSELNFVTSPYLQVIDEFLSRAIGLSIRTRALTLEERLVLLRYFIIKQTSFEIPTLQSWAEITDDFLSQVEMIWLDVLNDIKSKANHVTTAQWTMILACERAAYIHKLSRTSYDVFMMDFKRVLEFNAEKSFINIEIAKHKAIIRQFDFKLFYESGWEQSLIKLKQLLPQSKWAEKADDEIYGLVYPGNAWERLSNSLQAKEKSAALKMLKLFIENGIDRAVHVLNAHYNSAALQEAHRLFAFPNSNNIQMLVMYLLKQAASSKLDAAFSYLGLLTQDDSLETSFFYHYLAAKYQNLSSKQILEQALMDTESSERRFWGCLFLGLIEGKDELCKQAMQLNPEKVINYACKMNNEGFIDDNAQITLLCIAYQHSPDNKAIIQAGAKLLKSAFNYCGDCERDLPSDPGDEIVFGMFFIECVIEMALHEEIPICTRVQLIEFSLKFKQSELTRHTLNDLASQFKEKHSTHVCYTKKPQAQNRELSVLARNQIHFLVVLEMKKFNVADIEKATLVEALIDLTEFPYFEKDDNRMRSVLSIANSALIYYLLAPKMMHESIIDPYQVAHARLYLRELIHNEIVKLSVELGVLKEDPRSDEELPMPSLTVTPPAIYVRAPSSEFFTSPFRMLRESATNSSEPILMSNQTAR